jgi:RNA polymerase sigma-70 factor (ECF subfamily)
MPRVKKPPRPILAAFGDEQPRLARMLQGRVRCGATAADLLQDIWLKLAGRDAEAGAVNDPHAFVRGVARNAAIDHLRKERRRADIDAEVNGLLWESVDEASPERILMGREALAEIRRTLDGMPAQSREIFLMNRFGGKTHKAIAQELGIAEQTVHYHIRRVLDALARCRDALPD